MNEAVQHLQQLCPSIPYHPYHDFNCLRMTSNLLYTVFHPICFSHCLPWVAPAPLLHHSCPSQHTGPLYCTQPLVELKTNAASIVCQRLGELSVHRHFTRAELDFLTPDVTRKITNAALAASASADSAVMAALHAISPGDANPELQLSRCSQCGTG